MKIKQNGGFTLVEVLTVLAIIGIMTGIIGLNMAGEVKKYRLKEATTQFYSNLKKCRVDAMSKTSNDKTRGYGFTVNNATTYQTFEFNDTNNNYTYSTGEELNPTTITLPNGVQVRRETGTLTETLLFDRRGFLRSTSWATATGATYIFELAGISKARCVVLSINRIREGGWDATNSKCISN